MIATDEELNCAMAQACGWKLEHFGLPYDWGIRDPSGTLLAYEDEPIHLNLFQEYAPRYCTDRNTIEEIWTLLRSREPGVWTNYLRALMRYNNWNFVRIGEAVSASPRRHVECALIALNAWPEGREMPK